MIEYFFNWDSSRYLKIIFYFQIAKASGLKRTNSAKPCYRCCVGLGT